MKRKSLSDVLLHVPAGVWVALTPDKQNVIAYANTAAEVLLRARREGVQTPLVVRTPAANEGIAAAV